MNDMWLQETLRVLPAVLWMFFGMGIPYGLALLPRRDWQYWVRVVAVGMLAGSTLLTAWMFILGTIGSLRGEAWLRLDSVLIGSVVIALIGCGLAFWRSRQAYTETENINPQPFALDEKALIFVVIVALLVRWVVTSFWTFTAYDALWVYGYQARLWFTDGFISPDVGYYPQFLQLQYTFMQLVFDGISDHAARAVVPFLHLGSILAVYVLGQMLVNRRTGIIAATIWTLYPHVAQWAYVGDLEIPLTMSFTLSCTFFLKAWLTEERNYRRQYALIAGLCFGVAMWTKPTAGAFVWGVVLLVVADFIRLRPNLLTPVSRHEWWQRFEIAVITGLACLPLGAVWYVRNIAFGHPPLVLPNESWLTLATRSGDLLSWMVLALIASSVYVVISRKARNGWWFLPLGLTLIALGAIPSSPLIIRWFPAFTEAARVDPPFSYIRLYEWMLIITGTGFMLWHLWQYVERKLPYVTRVELWAYLLVLPYFVTWFYSYSYHARLVFAITPILLLPTAIAIAHLLSNQQVRNWALSKRILWTGLLVICGLPLTTITYTGVAPEDDWLWNTNRYPDDVSKYRVHNPGVTMVAERLIGWQNETGKSPIVVAPGEQRLHFFLFNAEIINDTIPTQFDEIEGATHFLYGTQARWRYEDDEGIPAKENQIVSGLGRDDIIEEVMTFGDGTFRYALYELFLEKRYVDPLEIIGQPNDENEVIIGDFVRYWGDNPGNNQLLGNRLFMPMLWEVLEPADKDYQLKLSLYHQPTETIYRDWIFEIGAYDSGYYRSTLWQSGEFIWDMPTFLLEDADDIPLGGGYKLIMNLIDRETGAHVSMMIDGEPVELGYVVKTDFFVGNE